MRLQLHLGTVSWFFMVFTLLMVKRPFLTAVAEVIKGEREPQARRLGVKPTGVPLGFKRCKRFLWFLSKSPLLP